MRSKFKIGAVALIGSFLSVGAAQLGWALPSCPVGTTLGQCVPGGVLYFIGKQNFDLGYSGYSTSALTGQITTNLGGPGGSFIDDDYMYGHSYNPLLGMTWSVTGVNAAYLGNTPSEIGLTKYGNGFGTQAAGVEAYSELAYLASEEFTVAGRDHNSSASLNLVGGVTLAGVDPLVSKELNEAIYYIADTGVKPAIDATAMNIVNKVEAAFGTLAAAETELKSASDIWFLNGGAGKPELILQYQYLPPNVPEGGSILGYLLMAVGMCFAAVVVGRRQRLSRNAGFQLL